eukprot:m.491036 g.491036  ORF g.491036 m.491036 type:complete len:585 (+) comp29051_c0_seq1:231-1985(+)
MLSASTLAFVVVAVVALQAVRVQATNTGTGTGTSAAVCNGWEQDAAADAAAAAATSTPTSAVWFSLAAASTDVDQALAAEVLAVSTPSSQRFRQYLSHDAVAKVVGPPTGVAERVRSWLVHNAGLPPHALAVSRHGDHVIVIPHSTVSLSMMSRALGNITLARYRHRSTGSVALRVAGLCQKHSKHTARSIVPAPLRSLVEAVHGIAELLPVRPRQSVDGNNQFKGINVDPNVIAQQYQLSPSDVGHAGRTSQAVAAFEDAQFRSSDVATFQHTYNLPPVTIKVLGPNNGGYFGEASLDTQYITASGRGVETWFVAQEAFNMLEWCEKVLNMTKVPSVLSVSWGGGESNYPLDHQTGATRCFQKLALLGTSVFAASGDDGTGKQGTVFCKKFDPTWPASCPWVTAVGATYINEASSAPLATRTEVGWDYSGGGFSANFPRPQYQASMADAYLAAQQKAGTLPPARLFNASGRATPDVAAVGTNYVVYSGGGSAGTLSGTSAATPTFAGMVTLINDALIGAGKPPVGFVNPALYAAGPAGAAGVDVTTGNNKDGNCPNGFAGAAGWDPVTGLGTPVFEKLKAILM